jgi:hypothetical protein
MRVDRSTSPDWTAEIYEKLVALLSVTALDAWECRVEMRDETKLLFVDEFR